ncbi:hypothetical protein TNCV_319971 [Trichonephila clavipes]|nr:hypothetical protein TNCV_319971 [Trichonephila clavipes]
MGAKASRRDRQFIRGSRVTADEPCESRLLKEMEKLKEEMQTIKAGRETQLRILWMRWNGTSEKKLSPIKEG